MKKSKLLLLLLLITNIVFAKENVSLGLYNLGPKSHIYNKKVDTTQGKLSLNAKTFSVTYILNVKQEGKPWEKGIVKTYEGNWNIIKDVNMIDEFKNNKIVYNKLKSGDATLCEFIFSDRKKMYAIFTIDSNYPEIQLQQNENFFVALNDNTCNTFIHKFK